MMYKLIADSERGLSLLQSATLREGWLAEGEAQEAVPYVLSHPDHRAYHLLFALRRSHPDVFASIPQEVRAEVLCSALRSVKSLNDWGYLDPDGSHDGDAAVALLETGQAAVDCLTAALGDMAEAPLFGSEAATMAVTYQYRRADFAYRYLSLILGLEPSFDPDPRARDEAIRELRGRLRT